MSFVSRKRNREVIFFFSCRVTRDVWQGVLNIVEVRRIVSEGALDLSMMPAFRSVKSMKLCWKSTMQVCLQRPPHDTGGSIRDVGLTDGLKWRTYLEQDD